MHAVLTVLIIALVLVLIALLRLMIKRRKTTVRFHHFLATPALARLLVQTVQASLPAGHTWNEAIFWSWSSDGSVEMRFYTCISNPSAGTPVPIVTHPLSPDLYRVLELGNPFTPALLSLPEDKAHPKFIGKIEI